MRIVLTHAYYIAEDEREKEIMRPYPPLGLLYISAYLRNSGFPNSVFDSTFSNVAEQRSFLLNDPPEVLAVYVNMMTKVKALALLSWLRKQASLKNTKVILGGPDLTYNVEAYLKHGADFLVLGEGEESCRELIQAIRMKNPWMEDIQGIAFINGLGEIHKGPPREKIKNIDVLPLPARDAIPMEKYMKTWKDFHGKSTISVSTQRGCPYTCKWCSTAVYGQSYRRRSPEAVSRELLHLKEHYNPDALWFVDDVFTVSHKWLKAFRDEVIKQNAIIPFECITRADRLNEEVIKVLKESGCFRVWIGAESGSQKVIDAMDRRVKVENVREMIVACKENGLEAGTFIMLGYPGEQEEDIEETIKHLKVSQPDHFTITIAYPIKGTGLYQEIEAKQTKDLEWEFSTDRDRDFERSYPRSYYDWAVRRVVNEVNYAKQVSKGRKFYPGSIKAKMKSEFAKVMMRRIRGSID